MINTLIYALKRLNHKKGAWEFNRFNIVNSFIVSVSLSKLQSVAQGVASSSLLSVCGVLTFLNSVTGEPWWEVEGLCVVLLQSIEMLIIVRSYHASVHGARSLVLIHEKRIVKIVWFCFNRHPAVKFIHLMTLQMRVCNVNYFTRATFDLSVLIKTQRTGIDDTISVLKF